MTRYPFAPLAQAMGLTPGQAAKHLGLSGSTWKQYRDEGMSELVADRRAVQAGLDPYVVWPEMLEQSIADAERLERERYERRLAQNRAWKHRNRERVNAYSREYRAKAKGYISKRQQAWYQANRERIAERERARYWADPERQRARKRKTQGSPSSCPQAGSGEVAA